MQINNLTLAKKAIVVISVFVLTAIGVDAYEYFVAAQISNASQTHTEDVVHVHKLSMVQAELDHAMRHAATAGTSKVSQLHLAEELSEAHEAVDSIILNGGLTPDESLELSELRTSIKNLFFSPLMGQIDDSYLQDIREVLDTSKRLHEAQESALQIQTTALENRNIWLYRLSGGSSVLLIFLAIGLGVWLSRNVSGRIIKITEAARALSKNDMSGIAINDSGNDELSLLARVLNENFKAASDAQERAGQCAEARTGALSNLETIRAALDDACRLQADDLTEVTLARLESIPEVVYAVAFIFDDGSDYDLLIGGSLAVELSLKPAKTLSKGDIAHFAAVERIRLEAPDNHSKIAEWVEDEGFPSVDSLALVPLGHGALARGLLVLGCCCPLEAGRLAVVETSAFALDCVIQANQTSSVLGSTGDYVQVFETIIKQSLGELANVEEARPLLKSLVRLMGMESSAIFIVADGKPVLNNHWADSRAREARTAEWQLLAQNTVSAAKTLSINDLSESPFFAAAGRDIHTRAVLATPLMVDNTVFGVVQFHSSEPKEFTTQDRRLIELLAERLAGALSKNTAIEQITALSRQHGGLLKTLSVPVFLTDAAGRIVSSSQGGRVMVGKSEDELRLSTIGELLMPESAARLLSVVDEDTRGGSGPRPIVLTFKGTTGPTKLDVLVNVLTSADRLEGLQLIGEGHGVFAWSSRSTESEKT